MNDFLSFLHGALGIDVPPTDLDIVQMTLRGLLVFLAALILIRLGHKRTLARKTPFDMVLLIIVGSVMSRAINGSAAFLPTLLAAAALVFLHRLFALTAYATDFFGFYVKGRPHVLVENGKYREDVMLRQHVSKNDIEEDMRLQGVDDLKKVRLARIERSGDISFVLD